MNNQKALAHEAAAVAHEEAANQSERCRSYTDEQRAEKDSHAAIDTLEEIRYNEDAQELSLLAMQATRKNPTDADMAAAEAAQAAFDAPLTCDRHPHQAEVMSRAAAREHRNAARQHRITAQLELNEEEWKEGYKLVAIMREDDTNKDTLRFLIDQLGPDWVRDWVKATKGEPRLEWAQCGECGWQRGIVRDDTEEGSTKEMGPCPRCQQDAWEPTAVEDTEEKVGDAVDLPADEQDEDWREQEDKGTLGLG